MNTAIQRSSVIDGAKVRWSRVGSGNSSLVFIHGGACDARSWHHQAAAFAKHYSVVTLDLPAHGHSEPFPDGIYTTDRYARVLEAIRHELDIKQVVVIGHSMGTAIVTRYAQLFPQYVAGVILVDGVIFEPATRRLFGELIQAASAGGITIDPMIARSPPDARQLIADMMLSAPPSAHEAVIQVMSDAAAPTSDAITAPCLGLYAEARYLPAEFEDLAFTKRLYPQFQTITIPDTSHFVMLDNPDAFNASMMNFLECAG